MSNWRNLRLCPPVKSCSICVKIGQDYEAYQFERYSETGWGLIKNLWTIDQCKIPEHALYIVLDDIK